QLARRADLSAGRRATRALGWFLGRAADVLPDLEILLRDSHWRVRRTAAEALGNLGVQAVPALAGLLKRRYDHESRVRAVSVTALARVVPSLPGEDRSWLGILADPAHGAAWNLRQVLARP